MKKSTFYYYVSLAYAASVPLNRIFPHPALDNKIQLCELIFLVALVFYLLKDFSFQAFTLSKFEKYSLIAIIVLLGGFFFNIDRIAILELIKYFYLWISFWLFSRILQLTEKKIEDVIRNMLIALVIASIIPAIIGLYLYGFHDQVTLLIRTWKSYPYLGQVVRVSGLSMTPGNLSTILSIGILMLIFQRFRYKNLILISAFIIWVFTLSKNGAPMLGLLLLGWLYLKKINHIFITVPILFFIIIGYLLPTLFVPVPLENSLTDERTHLLNEQNSFEFMKYRFHSTVYNELKLTSKKIILQNFPLGLGPASFYRNISHFKKQGLYPEYLAPLVTHDTYLGTIAEFGLFGLIALVFIFLGIFNAIQLLPTDPKYFILSLSLSLTVTYIAIQSILVDTQHLRHYWLVFIFLNVTSRQNFKTFSSI